MILSICEMPEVLRVLRIVDIVITIIRIVVPIILIVSAMVDLVKAINNAELNKITKPMVSKVAAAILVFMIPVFVRIIAIISGNSMEYEKCLSDLSTETISNAFNSREEGFVSAAEESNDITDYNVAMYNLINITDQNKRKEFEERLAKVKEKIDKRDEREDDESTTTVLPSIVEDSKFDKYKQIASCYSDTLKYRIVLNGNSYYAIIWAQNPHMQVNSALAKDGVGTASPETILSKVISSKGYSDKCLIATNASFFNTKTEAILLRIIINNGQVLKNTGNVTTIAVTKNNVLKEYVKQPLSVLQADGVRNNFSYSHAITPSSSKPNDTKNRTVLCQINSNNFVLISGRGESAYLDYISDNMVGPGRCFNLDGGGSRKLYYKTKTSGLKRQFGGDRRIPDMIYFSE